MDAATQNFVLAIAGLAATLISSALGLYFTARARTAPLRELLYSKQIDVALRFTQLIGKVRTLGPIVLDPTTAQFREQAIDDLRVIVRELSELSDTAAALLPTELWVEVQQAKEVVVDFLVAYDEGGDVGWFPVKLAGHSTKTALLARVYLGVDELSDESARLFTRKRRLKAVAALDPQELVESVRTQRQASPPST
jgi:hypothetical protein